MRARVTPHPQNRFLDVYTIDLTEDEVAMAVERTRNLHVPAVAQGREKRRKETSDRDTVLAGHQGTLAETAASVLFNREWTGADWGAGDLDGGVEVRSTHYYPKGRLAIKDIDKPGRLYIGVAMSGTTARFYGGYRLECQPRELPREWKGKKYHPDNPDYWLVPHRNLISMKGIYNKLKRSWI